MCLCVLAAGPYRPFVLLMLFDVAGSCTVYKNVHLCKRGSRFAKLSVVIALADWRLTLDRDTPLKFHFRTVYRVLGAWPLLPFIMVVWWV